MKKYCLNCNKELVKGQTKYCSIQCQTDYEFNQYIQRWKAKEETGLSGAYQLSKRVRRYMFQKANYQCEKCGWHEINPFTNLSPLEIHHKDGNYENSYEDNLIVLCPNCHSLTDNYKARGKGRTDREKYYKTNTCIDCGKRITNTAIRCNDCNNKYKVATHLENLPVTREELKQLIREKPFTEVGKMFNMTDSGIKRWCRNFNLPATKKEINKYSLEEWELI